MFALIHHVEVVHGSQVLIDFRLRKRSWLHIIAGPCAPMPPPPIISQSTPVPPGQAAVHHQPAPGVEQDDLFQ